MSDLYWSGQRIATRMLALAIPDGWPGRLSSSTSALALGSATPRSRFLVPSAQFDEFLAVHEECVIACHDAAGLFLSREARPDRCLDARYSPILLAASKFRIHDVGLLEQLIELARSGAAGPRSTLAEMLESFRLPTSNSLQSSSVRADPPSLLDMADETLRIYRRLRWTAYRLVGSLELDLEEPWEEWPPGVLEEPSKEWPPGVVEELLKNVPPKASEESSEEGPPGIGEKSSEQGRVSDWKKLSEKGPLSVGLQVQGAIASRFAEASGLRLRAGGLPEIRQACAMLWVEKSRVLRRHPASRAAYAWSDDEIRKDDDWQPVVDHVGLAEWLEKVAATEPAPFLPGVIPPRNRDGTISLSSEDWSDRNLLSDELQAWADLGAIASLGRLLGDRAVLDEGRLRPSYRILPDFTPTGPCLSRLRRLLKIDLFEPASGHTFIVGRLKDLALRCLVEIGERQGVESNLGGVFRAGKYAFERSPGDFEGPRGERFRPMFSVVWDLYRMEEEAAGREPVGHGVFRESLPVDPEYLLRLMSIASALLETIPRGEGSAHLRRILAPSIELSQKEADDLIKRIPDLDYMSDMLWYVEDITFELLERRLKCQFGDVVRLITNRTAGSHGAAIRNLLKGTKESPRTFRKLKKLCRDPDLSRKFASGKGDDELFRAVFRQHARSPAGRIRAGVFLSRGQKLEHLDFADDVMKTVLFRLALRYDLVGFDGDEFVIQARSSEAPGLMNEVGRLACEVASKMFESKDLSPPCVLVPRSSWGGSSNDAQDSLASF